VKKLEVNDGLYPSGFTRTYTVGVLQRLSDVYHPFFSHILLCPDGSIRRTRGPCICPRSRTGVRSLPDTPPSTINTGAVYALLRLRVGRDMRAACLSLTENHWRQLSRRSHDLRVFSSRLTVYPPLMTTTVFSLMNRLCFLRYPERWSLDLQKAQHPLRLWVQLWVVGRIFNTVGF
jgi:hypothetical protein